MAVKGVQTKRLGSSGETIVRYWKDLRNNDEGSPLEVYNWSELTVQVSGILHRAEASIQGSLDGETWADLLKIQDDSLHTINQKCCFIRPIIYGGDSLTGVSIYILGSK